MNGTLPVLKSARKAGPTARSAKLDDQGPIDDGGLGRGGEGGICTPQTPPKEASNTFVMEEQKTPHVRTREMKPARLPKESALIPDQVSSHL